MINMTSSHFLFSLYTSPFAHHSLFHSDFILLLSTLVSCAFFSVILFSFPGLISERLVLHFIGISPHTTITCIITCILFF